MSTLVNDKLSQIHQKQKSIELLERLRWFIFLFLAIVIFSFYWAFNLYFHLIAMCFDFVLMLLTSIYRKQQRSKNDKRSERSTSIQSHYNILLAWNDYKSVIYQWISTNHPNTSSYCLTRRDDIRIKKYVGSAFFGRCSRNRLHQCGKR